MKFAINWQWEYWRNFLWNYEGQYVSIGIGPLYVQFDWGAGIL